MSQPATDVVFSASPVKVRRQCSGDQRNGVSCEHFRRQPAFTPILCKTGAVIFRCDALSRGWNATPGHIEKPDGQTLADGVLGLEMQVGHIGKSGVTTARDDLPTADHFTLANQRAIMGEVKILGKQALAMIYNDRVSLAEEFAAGPTCGSVLFYPHNPTGSGGADW